MADEIRVVDHYSASIPNKVGEGALWEPCATRVSISLRSGATSTASAARIRSRRQCDACRRRKASQAQAAQRYRALHPRR